MLSQQNSYLAVELRSDPVGDDFSLFIGDGRIKFDKHCLLGHTELPLVLRGVLLVPLLLHLWEIAPHLLHQLRVLRRRHQVVGLLPRHDGVKGKVSLAPLGALKC